MKMLHTANGTLFKRVAVKVFHPGNRKHSSKIYSASVGKMFNPGGIDELLAQIAANIEREYPTQEYRLAQVGPAAYNFVHLGEKAGSSVAEGNG